MTKLLAVAAVLALAGCAPRYAYTFQLADPGAHPAAQPGGADQLEDADLKAEIAIDPSSDTVHVGLTNKTDQVLQVEWAQITFTRPDGRVTPLQPSGDAGWLLPGARASAELFPIALPRRGDAAAANEGRRFRLDIPVIVRREPKVYSYTLAAHVREL